MLQIHNTFKSLAPKCKYEYICFIAKWTKFPPSLTRNSWSTTWILLYVTPLQPMHTAWFTFFPPTRQIFRLNEAWKSSLSDSLLFTSFIFLLLFFRDDSLHCYLKKSTGCNCSLARSLRRAATAPSLSSVCPLAKECDRVPYSAAWSVRSKLINYTLCTWKPASRSCRNGNLFKIN